MKNLAGMSNHGKCQDGKQGIEDGKPGIIINLQLFRSNICSYALLCSKQGIEDSKQGIEDGKQGIEDNKS